MTVVEEQAISVQSVDTKYPAPTWFGTALASLLAITAVLYLWGLGSLGWANDFYAAAVQAGTQSWKALLFGSLDSGNAITVDKPPAAIWVMALSGRVFGFSTWSMLLPQALMGVGAVALLVASVRRVSGCGAGLLAGSALALTPVAALMFRFNNPDALLVLLSVAAAYCVIRALDGTTTRWIAIAGALVGLAFLTKLLQALLVTPAFALVVLVAIPGDIWHRLRVLLIGMATMVVSAGWYLALVSLWPSDSRPYIGGSTDNSLLQLALGYNGMGRVFGGDGNSHHDPAVELAPHGLGGFGGQAGITRLFSDSIGAEIAWLLAAALIGFLAVLWLRRSMPRTDRTRAALLLWGGWLIVSALVFSFMKGIMHPYYTIALAPAIAALVGMTSKELWQWRQIRSARAVLGVMLVASGATAFVILNRAPEWFPWLRWTLLIGTVVSAAILAVGYRLERWATTLAVAGLLFGLGGTAAYTVATVATAHSGSMPASGPHLAVTHNSGPGGPGGPRIDVTKSQQIMTMLAGADTRWSAATVGSRTAAAVELVLGKPVMAIGGFAGSDNSPMLAQFQKYVVQHQVRYFITTPDKGPGGPPRSDNAPTSGDQITQWVQQHFAPREIDGATVYDLGSPI